jgi:hypothetical protein
MSERQWQQEPNGRTLRSEFQRGAKIRSVGDAFLRVAIIVAAVTVAVLAPVHWYWKIVVFVLIMLLAGVIVPRVQEAVTLRAQSLAAFNADVLKDIGGFVRVGTTVLLSAGSAYALSFSSDLLLGGLVQVYPSTAFPAVVTWALIAAVLLLLAYKLAPYNLRWLALPFAALGGLAVVGGLVSPHPHDFGVAALLFIQAALMWWLGPQH